MRRKRVAVVVAFLTAVSFLYLKNGTKSANVSIESAKSEMSSVIADAENWRMASGSYIGTPKSDGVMLAAGDTMWGASRSFSTKDGDICLIAGNLGSGSKVSVASESKPCTRDGVRELQEYICSVEGKEQNCPEI